MCHKELQMTNQVSCSFCSLLENGLIPLGKTNLPIGLTLTEFLATLKVALVASPREWKVDNSEWIRWTVATCILWFPTRNVFFTFRDNLLVLVEFSDNRTPSDQWDYSFEIQTYFRLKEEARCHLGKESRSIERDEQNLETVWNFVGSSVYLACDIKTGGCALGLRPSQVTAKCEPGAVEKFSSL
jgi:hypothetical protein